MDTLTKGYFDEKLSEKLSEHTSRIKEKIEQEVHSLATMVAKGFADIEKRIDVRERVEKLERKMTKVGSALNVQL
jgi:hypothetical protein